MPDAQDLIHYVGLGIYTFTDLLADGLKVVQVVESWQKGFPTYPLTTFSAVTVAQQTAKAVVEARSIAWRDLRAGILAGRIARFQAQEAPTSLASKVQLLARLNAGGNSAGRPNHLITRLPQEAFGKDSGAASLLLAFGIEAFSALRAAYAYGGVRVTGRSSEAITRAINESIGKAPVGDFFDVNIDAQFREQVKGAFWANYLNAEHIERLGGLESVRAAAPCYLVKSFAGGVLLLLAPQPIWDDQRAAEIAYARLRDFLKPVTVDIQPNISSLLDSAGVIQRRSFNT